MQLSDLNNILKQYSLVATSFTDISDKGFSGALIFRVTTKDGDFILKCHSATTDITRVNFMLEVMDHACSNGFTKLPRPIRANSGEFTYSGNERVCEVMTIVPGSQLAGMPNEIQCEELGKAVAELHLSFRSFPDEKVLRRGGEVQTFESLDTRHKEFTKAIKENAQLFIKNGTLEIITKFVDSSRDVLKDYFVPKQFDKLQEYVPRIIHHKDLWGANIFFEGDKFTGFIDFVNVKHGVRINDLAKLAIEVLALSEKETTIFLRAYNSIWPLTEEEKQLLLPWILNWVIFSPFWHVERYIEETNKGEDNRSRYIGLVSSAQKILDRLVAGELDYLKGGAFLK